MIPPARRQPGDSPRYANKSLGKAFRILTCLSGPDKELGLSAIASRLNLNKTTVFRMLSVMQGLGVIERNPETGKYRLGLKLFELGCEVIGSRKLPGVARPFLEQLAKATRHTVHLAVLSQGEVVYLDKIDSTESLFSVPTGLGRRMPADYTGTGKVLLAHLSEDELNEFLAHTDVTKKIAADAPASREDLNRLLGEIRRKGYCFDRALDWGLCCISAPIRNHQNQVIAAVNIGGPAPRFRGRELTEQVHLVRKAADGISRMLGYRPVPNGARGAAR
jgi:DNA-binding IclR family transcriptional regulator